LKKESISPALAYVINCNVPELFTLRGFPCVYNRNGKDGYVHVMITSMWSGGMDQHFLNLGTRQRCVVRHTLRPLYLRGNSPR